MLGSPTPEVNAAARDASGGRACAVRATFFRRPVSGPPTLTFPSTWDRQSRREPSIPFRFPRPKSDDWRAIRAARVAVTSSAQHDESDRDGDMSDGASNPPLERFPPLR